MPITLKEATAFVARAHRHHGPPRGGLFAVAAAEGEPLEIVAVAIVGRPVARGLQDGWTAEVIRVAVKDDPNRRLPDGRERGYLNACSMLYGACWRAARALGYRKLVTYTLTTEPGTSLRGAGFKEIGAVKGRSWNCPSRPRVDLTPKQDKLRWERAA